MRTAPALESLGRRYGGRAATGTVQKCLDALKDMLGVAGMAELARMFVEMCANENDVGG